MTDYQKQFPIMQVLGIESQEELEKEYEENKPTPQESKIHSDVKKKSGNAKKIYKA